MGEKPHKNNKNLPECSGYASANLRVDSRGAQRLAFKKLIELSSQRRNRDSIPLFKDLEPAFDFNERFQVIYPENSSKEDQDPTEEYFVKKDEKGEPKYLLECHPYRPSPNCSVIFNSSSRPELLVELTFSMDLLGEWKKVIDAADKQISSWPTQKIETIKQ